MTIVAGIMGYIRYEEIKDEALWDKAFKDSQDALATFAAEAIAEDRAGKTRDLDPEKL